MLFLAASRAGVAGLMWAIGLGVLLPGCLVALILFTDRPRHRAVDAPFLVAMPAALAPDDGRPLQRGRLQANETELRWVPFGEEAQPVSANQLTFALADIGEISLGRGAWLGLSTPLSITTQEPKSENFLAGPPPRWVLGRFQSLLSNAPSARFKLTWKQ